MMIGDNRGGIGGTEEIVKGQWSLILDARGRKEA
jgi:hypothetical protein